VAVEARRGCGYRKIGGIYLETDPGEAFACGRLPIPLRPCPLCGQHPRFTRGLRQLRPKNVLHAAPACGHEGTRRCLLCPFNRVAQEDTVGLLWVGARFYTPASFIEEAVRQGISKRVSAIPRWFKVGVHWVFLAHEQAITTICDTCKGAGELPVQTGDAATDPALLESCESCESQGILYAPGVFYAFRPRRVVKIVSTKTPASDIGRLKEQGFEVRIVPHDDPDHQPSRHRGEEDE
jgi:hypothetical protein